jgi:hypothetical protein
MAPARAATHPPHRRELHEPPVEKSNVELGPVEKAGAEVEPPGSEVTRAGTSNGDAGPSSRNNAGSGPESGAPARPRADQEAATGSTPNEWTAARKPRARWSADAHESSPERLLSTREKERNDERVVERWAGSRGWCRAG